MVERWTTQGRIDDLGDIEGWMAQRNADVGLRQQADAVARKLWDQSTQDGSGLSAPQPSDLTSIGLAALGSGVTPDDAAFGPVDSNFNGAPKAEAAPQAFDGNSDAPAAQLPTATPSYQVITAQPGDSISRLMGTSRPHAIGRFARLNGLTGSTLTVGSSYAVPASYDDATAEEIAAGSQLLRSDNARLAVTHAVTNTGADPFAARLNSGLNIWTGAPPSYVAQPLAEAEARPWWDQWTPAKGIAGTAAAIAGLPVGFARGAIHLGQDVGNDLDFGARLLDPHDAENHLPGESAWDQVVDTGRGVLNSVQQRLTEPRRLAGDVSALGHEARVNLDPFPIEPTLGDQLHRNFSVGENWGEGSFDLGALGGGGELVKGAKGAEIVSGATEIPEYVRPDASLELKAYLAEPYDGGGAHFIPRRAKFKETMMGVPTPKALVGKPVLPSWFMESPFNLWKPRDISRGKFYAEHFRTDDRMFGASLPRQLDGGRGWSGNRLGLERYGPAGRVWRGAPVPLKAAVGAGSAAAGLGIYDGLNPGVPQ